MFVTSKGKGVVIHARPLIHAATATASKPKASRQKKTNGPTAGPWHREAERVGRSVRRSQLENKQWQAAREPPGSATT